MVSEKYHLSGTAKIILAIICSASIQLFGIIWWASGITHRVEVLERSVLRHDSFIARVAAIETDVRWIRAELEKRPAHRE